MVPHQWPVALAVIWHIYSCLACSSEDSARDLPSSGKVILGQGRSPVSFGQISPGSVFQGEELRQGSFQPCPARMVHRPWPVAPDMIWHIYLHLYCSSKDGGRDLPSSGEAAPTMGQVPCEFWADRHKFSFSGEEPRQGSFQPCPAQDGALSMQPFPLPGPWLVQGRSPKFWLTGPNFTVSLWSPTMC